MSFESKMIICLLIIILCLVFKLIHIEVRLGKLKEQQMSDYKTNQKIISKCNEAINGVKKVERMLKQPVERKQR